MADRNAPDFSVNKIVHEQARLAILTYLAGNRQKKVAFTDLRKNLDMTAGNLSVQLRNLEDAGYVKITKTFEGRKPQTSVSLTLSGLSALKTYIEQMEAIIKAIKNGGAEDVCTDEQKTDT
ncbi:MAG: transcriptional regulator [Bacillota bacterium]